MAVDATVALAAGTALALGAALVVLGPLWRGDASAALPTDPTPGAPLPDDTATRRAEGVSAVEALREIEFDRATGKLSDEDYQTLKATYTREALAEMRAAEARAGAGAASATQAATAAAPDPVEAALAAYRARRGGAAGGRVCPVDGPRPEGDAAFCSACGRYLGGACPRCGAPCDQEGQRFCTACGGGLAAGALATGALAAGAGAPAAPQAA